VGSDTLAGVEKPLGDCTVMPAPATTSGTERTATGQTTCVDALCRDTKLSESVASAPAVTSTEMGFSVVSAV